MNTRNKPRTEKIYFRELRKFDVSRVKVGSPDEFDLKNHVYLKTHTTIAGELEEWVHKDDFQHYMETERKSKK
jgi:hypothetical protein